MRVTLAEVLNQLVAEGLATPDSIRRARAAYQGAADTTPPWYVRVIAGFGAWVATGFLLGFLFATKLVDEYQRGIVVGAILIAAAVYLRRHARPDEEFKRQLSLAVSLAGQVLVIAGVGGETHSLGAAGIVALAISIAIIASVSDQAHRFMSALIGSIGLFATMASFKLAGGVGSPGPLGRIVVRGSDIVAIALVTLTGYVWRTRVRDRSREAAELLEPVGYGMIAGLLIVLAFSSWFVALGDLATGSGAGAAAWVLGPATTMGIAIVLTMLTVEICHELRVRSLLAATPIALALLTLSTPGIVAAITLLVLGFDRRNRVLIGLAAAFLIKFLSLHYYSLHMTLLEKSIALVTSGVLLLAARVYLELRHKPTVAEA